jgi:hypothetical protein
MGARGSTARSQPAVGGGPPLRGARRCTRPGRKHPADNEPCRRRSPRHRDRSKQPEWPCRGRYPLLVALPRRIDNGVPIPTLFGIGVQQPSSQIVDTVDSHASMREEAIIRCERLLRGRIVHIDRLAVWHVDTQCAQGIFAAWLLAES